MSNISKTNHQSSIHQPSNQDIEKLKAKQKNGMKLKPEEKEALKAFHDRNKHKAPVAIPAVDRMEKPAGSAIPQQNQPKPGI